MALYFTVLITPSEKLRRGLRSVWVYVNDGGEHPYSLKFEYVLAYLNDQEADKQVGGPIDPEGPTSIRLWKFSVERPGQTHLAFGAGDDLALGQLRDVPLQAWETAAREYLAQATGWQAFKETVASQIEEVTLVSSDGEVTVTGPGGMVVKRARDSLDKDARRFLARLKPPIEEGDTPASRRTYQSHLRLARVSIHYRICLMEGRSDPARDIAVVEGVSPGAARNLIHRARKAGYLGEAIGRTAGQRHGNPDKQGGEKE